MTQRVYPDLQRVPDGPVRRVLRSILDQLQATGTTVTALPSDLLSRDEIEALYGAPAMRTALQLGGTHILNVTGLPGLPKEGVIYQGTHAERLLTFAATAYPEDTVFWETDRTAFYQVREVAGVRTWVLLMNRPFQGTISPDLKPADLGTNDVGFLFYSTDYDRIYRWSGAAWADAPMSPARWQLSFFVAAPVPTTGWRYCNGVAGFASTAIGGVAAYTPPDLITASKFLRTAAAAGGTGGADTHLHSVDPPSTQTGDDTAWNTVTVAAGTNAALHPHQHAVDIAAFDSALGSTLPAYWEGLPYIRV